MDEPVGVIYGLELQARALTPQYAEGNEVRFLIATNSLKPTNQVHLLEYNEEKSTIQAKIFEHSLGEVWKLNSSPHDPRLLTTCYNVTKGTQVETRAALLTMPEDLNEPIKTEYIPWQQVEILETEELGERVKTVEFHPSQSDILACVVDNKVVIFNRSESQTRIAAEIPISANAKSAASFSTGKWSHHHQGNQFVTLHDNHIRSFDVRDTQHCAWAIEDSHTHLVRDLDCNPNKQCHIVTGGDDNCIKIWDYRMAKEPVFARNDHAHWVWCVRFNTFHDQLILSSSSDCKVMLTCASSVSSEAPDGISAIDERMPAEQGQVSDSDRRRLLSDGLLHTFDQHEDSVYCVEWSNVEPWIFASLSYDGRVLISKVPKQYKYQIIL